MECYYCGRNIDDAAQLKSTTAEMRLAVESSVLTEKFQIKMVDINRCKRCAWLHKVQLYANYILMVPYIILFCILLTPLLGFFVGALLAYFTASFFFYPLKKMLGIKSSDDVNEYEQVKVLLSEGWKVKTVD